MLSYLIFMNMVYYLTYTNMVSYYTYIYIYSQLICNFYKCVNFCAQNRQEKL